MRLRILIVALFSGCGHSAPVVANPGPQAQPVDMAVQVTSALVPPVQVKGAPTVHYALDAEMKRRHVPGVSLAVADGGHLLWARGFGVKQTGTGDPVTPTTLFPAASISKALTATATLRLVDEGKLSLDENVNAYLRSWKVPDNEFTATAKVTLRRLLSHTAGTGVHMFLCYREGEPIPTVPQELNGEKPANTGPVRVEAVPGSTWRYSGGGVLIEQLVLTEVTGESFPELMSRLVLEPTGMKDSTFEQPLPRPLRPRMAAEHDASGAVTEDWFRVCPEMAASGLWTTPSDLLAWALGIADAWAGKSTRVLSRSMAKQMLTVQMGPSGLGPFVEGSGHALHFGHEGADDGFLSEVVYFPETGQGAAVMVNGAGGRSLIRETLYAVAAHYGWPEYVPATIESVSVPEAVLNGCIGVYEVPYEGLVITATVTRQQDKLFLKVPLLNIDSEVVFTSPTKLVMLDIGDSFEIVQDSSGEVTALRFGKHDIPRRSETR